MTKSISNNSIKLVKQQGISLYLKILINHFQIVAIIHELDIKWPFYVEEYLNILSNIGYVSSNFSFECVFNLLNIDLDDMYIETLMILLIPLFLIIIAAIIILTYGIIKNKSQNIKLIIMIIVVHMLLQPSILKKLLDNINCRSINGIYRLVDNLAIECESDEHSLWVYLYRI